MLSFVSIVWPIGGLNAELRRVVIVDLIASIVLLVAVLLDPVSARNSGAG